MDNNLSKTKEANESSHNNNDGGGNGHQSYDFDYPSFETCGSPNVSRTSTTLIDNLIPSGGRSRSNNSITSGSGGLMTPSKKSSTTTNNNNNNDSRNNSNNNLSNIETKVIKFPAKNVPKNAEKFFADLKSKVSQLNSQIIVTKLPCSGYNILVKSPREKATDAVSLVERELQPKITKKLRLEPRRFALLTAKNFEVVKETLATDESSKNVTVSSQQNNTLTLNGIAPDVSRALQLITKYMDKAAASETLTLDDIPPKFYSLIRGAFNCNITRIITECDNCVCVDIPQATILQNSNTQPITIVGPQEYQLKAKNEIINVYNVVRKNAIVKTFKISAPLHTNIRRACGLDKILKETNVAVLLPTEDQPQQDSVAFVGNSKDIPNAFHLSLARARVYMYREMPCKPWILKIMKQKPHLTFSDLKLNFPHTWISYLTPKECIALDGPSEEVETIKEIYRREIENVTLNITFTTIRVPSSYLEHIKGLGSRITKKICEATKTKIDINNIATVGGGSVGSSTSTLETTSIDNQITVITIFGKKEDLEEAGELFNEYITQLNETSTLEINIDSLLLPYISTANNSIQMEIRHTFGSSIRVSVKNLRNKRISTITFVGKKGAVLGAQSFLDDIVKRVTNETVIHEVTIPVAYHHLLVGKKGAVRDEIIECSGIDKIVFPNVSAAGSAMTNTDDYYQSPPDVITLVGSSKACKLAEVLMIEKCNMDVELDQLDIQLPKSLIEKLRLGDGIILRRIIANCVSSNSVIVDDSPKSNAINVYLPTGAELQAINHVRIHGYKSYTKAVAQKLLNHASSNSFFVESFNVDDDLIKSIIGRGGSQLKKFSEASSVDIIIASNKPKKGKSAKANNTTTTTKSTNSATSTPTDNVYLTGINQAEIAKIKNQIIKFVKELKDISELTTNVKKMHIKRFFIRKGENESLITQLSSKYSAVKITMPKEAEDSNSPPEEDDTMKQIRLKGPSKMVNNVNTEIANLAKKWDATIRIEFTLPYDHANLLRNIEQPNFASIGKEFDVTIRSFRDGDKATKPTSDTTISVVIEGVNKDVESAKDKIYACGPVTEQFTAPRQYHRALIGTKGVELKKIVDGFNVNITFPDSESNSDEIIVRGPKQQIKSVLDRFKIALEAAKKKQMDWEKNNHIVEMTIDSKWFSKLIGRGGKQIKALKTKLNVAITIPKNEDESTLTTVVDKVTDTDTTNDTNNTNNNNNSVEGDNGNEHKNDAVVSTKNQSQIILRGEKKLCEQAKKTIEAMVHEWENTITTEFELPKSIHGKIRGARSITISKIQKRFKVEVRFAPIDEEENNTINVSGLQHNVDNAINHIKELATQFIAAVEDDDSESYQIPTNLHSWDNFKFTAIVDSSSRVSTNTPLLSVTPQPTTTTTSSKRVSVTLDTPLGSDDGERGNVGALGDDDVVAEQQTDLSNESLILKSNNDEKANDELLQQSHSNHSVTDDLEPNTTTTTPSSPLPPLSLVDDSPLDDQQDK